MEPHDFEASLKAEGFNPGVVVVKPAGYAMDVHTHPFEAWALITDGTITLRVLDVATTYGTGDTFRLPAETSHSESAGPGGATYLAGRKYRAPA